MYAHGIYRLSGALWELMMEGTDECRLDCFTDVDLHFEELLEPVASVVRKVKSGAIPEYVGREVYEQRIEQLQQAPCYLPNEFPTWEDYLNGELDQCWIDEAPSWSIFTNNWAATYPSGIGHEFDALHIAMASSAEFVAIMDHSNCELTVVRSPYAANRAFLQEWSWHDGDTKHYDADGEKDGDCPTYVLSENFERTLFELAEEQVRHNRFHNDPNKNPTDEEIAELVEDELGYLPGSLPRAFPVGVPSDTGTNRLDEPQAPADRAGRL